MPTLVREQFLPLSPEVVWDFFATPANLNAVTPDSLEFKITSQVPTEMYEGLIITYKIKPMLNIPLDWVTEITHIHAPHFFVDEQRSGPYKIWHHEHHFRPTEGGVIMIDKLYYEIGMSFIGWIAGQLFVHKKVREIFDFRYKALEEKFGKRSSLK